jgi:hypothetical protein
MINYEKKYNEEWWRPERYKRQRRFLTIMIGLAAISAVTIFGIAAMLFVF